MKLVVGLGNPGKEYENTKHNVGFEVLDAYAKQNKLVFDKNKFGGIYLITNINNEKVIFLKPQKYMNLSGEVVRDISKFYKINSEDILIIQDDLDLSVGQIKLKQNSSSGGHNGIKNIEKNLETKNYKRLKIGISNDKKIDTKSYVLGKFDKESREIINNSIDISINIIKDYFYNDFDKLMNKYN